MEKMIGQNSDVYFFEKNVINNSKGLLVIGFVGIIMFFYVFIEKYNINILAVSFTSLAISIYLIAKAILNYKLLKKQINTKRFRIIFASILIPLAIIGYLIVMFL